MHARSPGKGSDSRDHKNGGRRKERSRRSRSRSHSGSRGAHKTDSGRQEGRHREDRDELERWSPERPEPKHGRDVNDHRRRADSRERSPRRKDRSRDDRRSTRRSATPPRRGKRGRSPRESKHPPKEPEPPQRNGKSRESASASPTPRKLARSKDEGTPQPKEGRAAARSRSGTGDSSSDTLGRRGERPGAEAAAAATNAQRRGERDAAHKGAGASAAADVAAAGGGGARIAGREDGAKKPVWGTQENEEGAEEGDEAPKAVEKPDFGLSGALAHDAVTGNTYKGVVLKFSEPADARKPTKRWRLYVFKGDEQEQLAILHIHRQSAYLVGREQKIADIHVAHPSCSKQHAVVQFRYRPADAANAGSGAPPKGEVLPYVMDLQSANGTFINGVKMEHSRYYELREKDVIKFGMSSRDYILLHEGSNED